MSVRTIGAFLKKNRAWKLCPRQMSISRRYEFKDFKSAVNFIVRLGRTAEQLNHHPDILLKQYRFVTVRTTTHSAKRLTPIDLNLAGKADEIYLQLVSL